MAVSSAQSNYDIFLEHFWHHMRLSKPLDHSRGYSTRQEIHGGDTPRGFYSLSSGERQAAGESVDGQILVDEFATRLFMALPEDLRTISPSIIQKDPNLAEPYRKSYSLSKTMLICSNLPDDLDETAKTYLGIAKDANIKRLYVPIVSDYVRAASQNHGSCEICQRHRFKLTEHHLIPRVMHGRFLKQGLYSKHQLKQVAWLCRGCHEFIHQRMKPSVLAKKYSSVELLLGRRDVREWAKSLRQIVRKAGRFRVIR